MKRKAQAIWKGTGMEGSGILNTPSGVFKDQPYSFKSRFQNDDGSLGTNPEELIAAAHAGCFNMALSLMLSNAGFPPVGLSTDAVLTIEKEEAGWAIQKIKLHLEATVPGISSEQFAELADKAKKGCPISKLLNCPIELEARLSLV